MNKSSKPKRTSDAPAVEKKPAHAQSGKSRLDELLVARGLAESREKARRLILAGKVDVERVSNPKPGMRVSKTANVSVKEQDRYVSRGGIKLEAALVRFGVSATDRICVDIGASTGGFTDCLLQHGAQRVYAIDVGASQMHERLRADPRVVLVEHTNARGLGNSPKGDQPALLGSGSLIVIDVSFISLSKILPAAARIAAPGADLISLIKPQFEATRQAVSRGKGVIKDPAVHLEVLTTVIGSASGWGWNPLDLTVSPIAGGSGNREYLLHAKLRESSHSEVSADLSRFVIAELVTAALG